MRRFIRSRGLLVPLVALAILGLLAIEKPSPARAAALTDVGWTVSNSQILSTNAIYS